MNLGEDNMLLVLRFSIVIDGVLLKKHETCGANTSLTYFSYLFLRAPVCAVKALCHC